MEQDNNLDDIAHIIAYAQIREYEENELINQLFKLIAGTPRL